MLFMLMPVDVLERDEWIQQHNPSFGHYVLLIFVRLGNTHESREPLKRQLPPQFRVRLTRQRVMRAVEHFLWLNHQLTRRKGRDCHRCGSEPLHNEQYSYSMRR